MASTPSDRIVRRDRMWAVSLALAVGGGIVVLLCIAVLGLRLHGQQATPLMMTGLVAGAVVGAVLAFVGITRMRKAMNAGSPRPTDPEGR